VSDRPTFFRSPAEFRRWLERNHAKEAELWVGFHKKDSGRASITWPEAVDEALCFGWIDGVRYRIDETSYRIRFTPRKPRSVWSLVNVKRVAALKKLGRMRAAGLQAFGRADPKRSRTYSYERRNPTLGAAHEKKLRANKRAWIFFQAQPPSYRRMVTWWVVSAKQEDTQRRRLATLIAHLEAGRRLGMFTRTGDRS
jgi:uncharacterized protein YdeI (YjbR/CyaY-like superfamily)